MTTFNPQFTGFSATAALLVVPESEFRRLAPATGHYHGRFYLQFTHHQIEATLPLRQGADVRNGNYRVVLDSVLASPGHMDLWLHESDAASTFDRRPTAERTYYLRNRRSGTALEARANESDIAPLPRMISGITVSRALSGFVAAGINLRFPPAWAGQRFDALDETWLRDADLLVVRSTREGSVERTLDIDGFPLDATAPTETRIEP